LEGYKDSNLPSERGVRKQLLEFYLNTRDTSSKDEAEASPTKGDMMLEKAIGRTEFKLYSASLLGLQEAKTDCRLQMVSIVKEVNSIN
jgi:hypothetical protein